MLDVTSSYLVAAYHALCDPPEGVDAAIWAFLGVSERIPFPESWFEDTTSEQVIVSKPGRLNARMNAQSGAFLVPHSVEEPLKQQISNAFDTNLDSLTEYKVAEVEKAKAHQVWKLVIPGSVHNELFRFVSRCNVRAYTLFPDMEGFGKGLREMMRMWH